jgi:peptidyl-prolyl cis-trans isomerase SurA
VTLPAFAQGLFSPAILVNDGVITNYEIKQRTLLLSIIQSLGSSEKLAREQLIEDRLKMSAATAVGISLTEEGVVEGISEFAARADMKGPEFLAALKQEGVDKETFVDYVRVGLTWRGLIQAKFGGRITIDEAEIDRALAANSGGLRVLMSEIIIPIDPKTEDQVMELAGQISALRSTKAFSDAAKKFSAAPTRSVGGQIKWLPISELPPALRDVIFELSPGEVTEPVRLPNGKAIALFQLRGIEEIAQKAPKFAAIEYATMYLPGGRTPETLAQAAGIIARVDTCDDLYAEALGQAPEVLVREAQAPADIPRDIAAELATLDKHEISTKLTRSNGQSLMVLMLCSRTAAVNEDVSREVVAAALRDQRLGSFARSFLAELRSDAIIIEK